MACSETYKGRDGQAKEMTSFVSVTCWPPSSDLAQNLLKGDREALERIILQMGTEHEAIFEECKRLYKERDELKAEIADLTQEVKRLQHDEGHVLHVEDLPTYPDARWLRHDVGPDGMEVVTIAVTGDDDEE